MVLNKIKEKIKSLSGPEKIIMFSVFALFISTLLPWYSDVDKYGDGVTYLGITGPLYLSGFIILSLSALSIFFIFTKSEFKIIPLNDKNIHIVTITLSALMIVLVSSVYFHPKFGMNISNKKAGFGMLLATMSLVTTVLGVLLSSKIKKNRFTNLDRHSQSLDSIIPEKISNNSSDIKIPQNDEELNSERFSYFSGSGIDNNNNNNY